MSDTVFFNKTAPQASAFQVSAVKVVAARMMIFAEMTRAALSEWRHNYRSRRELALYTRHERNDLNFSAHVDAEIAKPFWSK